MPRKIHIQFDSQDRPYTNLSTTELRTEGFLSSNTLEKMFQHVDYINVQVNGKTNAQLFPFDEDSAPAGTIVDLSDDSDDASDDEEESVERVA